MELELNIINRNRILKKKKGLKAFQNIVSIFDIKSINSIFLVFICRASRICSHSLLILCAIIVVFFTRIF